jgi:hypothetical protein
VQVVEHGQPELGALGLLPPDPQRLAVTVDADADRQIAGAGADRAVLADLHLQGVEVDDRIDPLQRPTAPGGDVVQDRVGDPRDRVAADLDAVETLQVRGDIPDAHTAGVEVEHPVVEPGQLGLALLDQLRLERAGAVARGAHGHGPEVGPQRLGRVPVAVVAGAARRRLPRRVAQVLGQLGAQRRLQHPAGELAHQPTRPSDLLRPQSLQRILERVVGQQAREPIPDLLNRTLVIGGTRRISPLRKTN